MGSTNLKQALQYKMGLWAGELADRQKKVAEILSLYESLPELNARSERLKVVLDCAGEVMKEIDPTWSPAAIKPVKPFAHKNGVRLGQTTKLALDILREGLGNLTARELAVQVAQRDGGRALTEQDLQRLTNAVDAGLRAKVGTLVQYDDSRPRRWRIEITDG